MTRAAAAIGICLCLLSTAASPQWTPRASPEPYVRSLYAVPDSPSPGSTTLYAASLGGGMFKGIDDGAAITWQPMATSLPTTRLFSLLHEGATFYVATDGYGIQKTTNGGTTFTAFNGSGGGSLGCMRVRTVTRSGSEFYAGTSCRYDSGLWRSTDAGANWTRLGIGTVPTDAIANSFLVDDSTGLMLLSTANYGIFRSVDGGATWSAANAGIPDTPLNGAPNVYSIQCGASCSTLLLATVFGVGMYKSVDAGTNWTDSSTGLPVGAPFAAGSSRDTSTAPFSFYVAIDGLGVFQSLDSGATWSAWGNTTTDPLVKYVRALVALGGGKFYANKFDGVARTADGGTTWTAATMGRGTYNSIVHNTSDNAIAFVASSTVHRIGDIYAADYAAVTTLSDTGIQGTTRDGAIYQTGSLFYFGTLFVTTNNWGVFRSLNTGATWEPASSGLPVLLGQAPRLALDRSNDNVLYLGSSGYPGIGIYKTTNRGTSWTEANLGLPTGRARSVNNIFQDRFVASTLYAATDAGLYKSTNSGGSWSLFYSAVDGVGNPLPVERANQSRSTAAELYIVNHHVNPDGVLLPSSGILRSIDGGATWTNRLAKKAQNLLLLNGDVLVAGLADGPGQPAVMRSLDKGATWLNIASGMAGYDIRAMAITFDAGAVVSASLENGFYTASGLQSLHFAAQNYAVSEAGVNAVVTVSRSGGTTGTATVNYTTLSGQANPGIDFTTKFGTLTFAPGVASQTITVPIVNDASIEPSEFFSVQLSRPIGPAGNAMLGTPRRAFVTIADNDNLFRFASASAVVNENGPNGTLTVTRTGSVGSAATVSWSTSNGTALAGQDFGAAGSATQRSGVLSWAAGDGSSKTITIGPVMATGAYIPILNDAGIEPPETFTVRLTSAAGGVLDSPNIATVTIVSEERGVSMVAATRSVVESSGAALLEVARSGPSTGEVTVQYGFTNSTAVNGVHFTGTPGTLTWPDGDVAPKLVEVLVANNSAVNAARTFTMTLSNPTNAALGTPSSTVVTLTDDDNTLQFASATASVSEGAGNLTLSVTRLGGTGAPASVSWTTANGTAIAGIDFGYLLGSSQVSGTLSWAANDGAPKTLSIPIINFLTGPEPVKTFTVALSAPVGSGASLGSTSLVTVTLVDDDAGVIFAAPDYSVNENAPSVTITVHRVGPAAAAASVTWTTVNGTAASGTEFGIAGNAAPRTGLLSWLAGSATPKTIVIPILNDAIVDGDKTFTVVLGPPAVGVAIGAPGAATVTIHDDDIPPESTVAFTLPKFMVFENLGPALLTVTRTDLGGAVLASSVKFSTVAGSALATSDYTTVTLGTVSWGVGEFGPKNISIPIVNNAIAEPPEFFKVVLSAPNPGTGLGLAEATVLIVDDDEVFPLDGAMPVGFSIAPAATTGWHVSNDPGAYEGAFTLKSDEIDNNESAGIEMSGTFAAGNVSFRVKVSSEAGFDKLQFYIDGVPQTTWSGVAVPGWQLSPTYVLSAGVHTLSWVYVKDGSVSVGMDSVHLDSLTTPLFTP